MRRQHAVTELRQARTSAVHRPSAVLKLAVSAVSSVFGGFNWQHEQLDATGGQCERLFGADCHLLKCGGGSLRVRCAGQWTASAVSSDVERFHLCHKQLSPRHPFVHSGRDPQGGTRRHGRGFDTCPDTRPRSSQRECFSHMGNSPCTQSPWGLVSDASEGEGTARTMRL